MSIDKLGDVFSVARTLLNDDDASNWTDQKLRFKAKQAFKELEAELILAGIPIISSTTTVITVPSVSDNDNSQDLSTISGYPTDMIMPIWLKERQVGQTNRDFVDMIEVDFIPNLQKTTTL